MAQPQHPPIEPHLVLKDQAHTVRTTTRLMGFLGYGAVILAAILLGGDLAAYINMPSAVFVIGGTGALLLFTFGHDGCLTAMRLAIRGKRKVEHTPTIPRGDPVVFFRLAAAYALTMGFVGTLIGIVAMLSNMDDPSKIGSGMATALLTTLYGSLLANIIFLPMSDKLAQRTLEEVLAKTIVIHGVMAIQSGDNPRNVQSKLVTFIAPAARAASQDKAAA